MPCSDVVSGRRAPVALAAIVTAAVVALTAAAALAACSPAPPPTGEANATAGVLTAAGSTPPNAAASTQSAASVAPTITPPTSAAASRVTTSLLRVHLPRPLSRAVVATHDGSLLVMGGLAAPGTLGGILRLDLADGGVAAAGHLAAAVHDAAGAPLGNGWLVLGGGATIAAAKVQLVTFSGGAVNSAAAGSLPAPRADGTAVLAAGRVVLVGGGRGGAPDANVLATGDGRHFTVLGRLTVPVRYGAAVSAGGAIYVFGGTVASGGATDAVQRIDPATGAVRIVGKLPRALTEASAFALGGRILIAGGMRAGHPTSQVLEFSPSTGLTAVVGRLPLALADAGVAVLGDAAYLVGGETGTAYLDTVIAVR
jgi:hypothetical protein